MATSNVVTANVPFLTRLLADGFVLWVVKNKDAATQAAHASLWTQLAQAFIGLNDGDAATASSALAAVTSSVTDPAELALISDGLAIAENNLSAIQKILGGTVAGSTATTLLNGFWQQVSAVAGKYVPAQASVAAPAPAATQAASPVAVVVPATVSSTKAA